MKRTGELLAAFGRFWWDFLIGENPDAFIGTVAIVVAALLLRHERAALVTVLPLLALACLGISTFRGRVRASR